MELRMPSHVRRPSRVVKESERLENWLLANFQYLRLCFADIDGVALGKMIPVQHAISALHDGVTTSADVATLASSTDNGPSEPDHASVIMQPDAVTIHAIPWADVKLDCVSPHTARVAEVMCHLKTKDCGPTSAPVSLSQCTGPRALLLRQIQRLEKEFGLTVTSAFDAEFLLTTKEEKLDARGPGRLMSNVLAAPFNPLLLHMEQNLRQAGVDILDVHSKSAAGQMQFTLTPSEGIKSADQLFILKQGVHEMSAQKGMAASFMSRRSPAHSNSLCFRFSLRKKETNENVLEDEAADDRLSEMARQVLAGLIRHCGSLCPIYAPTVNCYRRFTEKTVPSFANWGSDNRQAAFSVAFDASSGVMFENHLNGGLANPYLVKAATLAACMEGLTTKSECPPAMSNDAARLPANLADALRLLEADTGIRAALGDEYIQTLIGYRRKVALAHFADADVSNMSLENIMKEVQYYEELF